MVLRTRAGPLTPRPCCTLCRFSRPPFISIGTNPNPYTRAGNRATQVTFCGAPEVGHLVFHGVLEANTMAAHLGLSRFYFKFREEFYGYAGGKPRAAKSNQTSPA